MHWIRTFKRGDMYARQENSNRPNQESPKQKLPSFLKRSSAI